MTDRKLGNLHIGKYLTKEQIEQIKEQARADERAKMEHLIELKPFEKYNADFSTVEGTERYMRCLFDTTSTCCILSDEAKEKAFGLFKDNIRSLLKSVKDEAYAKGRDAERSEQAHLWETSIETHKSAWMKKGQADLIEKLSHKLRFVLNGTVFIQYSDITKASESLEGEGRESGKSKPTKPEKPCKHIYKKSDVVGGTYCQRCWQPKPENTGGKR